MTSGLEVISPGMMTTVQDLGRFGYQARGVSVSGAMDRDGLQLANSLVGNPPATGALEIRLLGPGFKVLAESVSIALYGTSAPIEVISPEKQVIPAGRNIILSRGDIFRIGAVGDTAACYLAVEGGFNLPEVYGSQSTYLPAQLGGFEGRALKEGDVLPLNLNHVTAHRYRALPNGPAHQARTEDDNVIRVIAGPQADYFTDAALAMLCQDSYTVSAETNRMGMRLEGAQLAHQSGFNIASDGIVRGAIQVPGNGLPIILLADCQTTGGYPKIATVISADLPKLGRMMPGAEFRFQYVSVTEAEDLARQHQDHLHARMASIRSFSGDDQELASLLMSENLISGVTAGD